MRAVIEILRGASGQLYVAIGTEGDATTRVAGPRDGPYQVVDERTTSPAQLIESLRDIADDLETRLDDERRRSQPQ